MQLYLFVLLVASEVVRFFFFMWLGYHFRHTHYDKLKSFDRIAIKLDDAHVSFSVEINLCFCSIDVTSWH